jgi:ABC-2 type transport system permease protein
MKVAYKFMLKEALQFRKIFMWLFLSFCGLILAATWKMFDKSANPTDSYVNVVNIFVFRLLPLTSAIYTTMVLAQEIEQKTIVYLLTRPIPRWKLLLGRWMGTTTAVALLSAASIVLAFAGSGGAKASVVNDFIAILLGAMAYGSLFLFVTLIFNRALIICVLFAFGWESSVPNLPTGLQGLSILSHMQSIARHPESENGKEFLELIAGTYSGGNLTTSGSIFTLIVLSVVMAGMSAYWFTTHEYLPREDTE